MNEPDLGKQSVTWKDRQKQNKRYRKVCKKYGGKLGGKRKN